jgi:hypothetical protein
MTPRADKAVDKMRAWEEAEKVFVVTSLIYALADGLDNTIRQMGEQLIEQMEFYWVLEEQDISMPPRWGGA